MNSIAKQRWNRLRASLLQQYPAIREKRKAVHAAQKLRAAAVYASTYSRPYWKRYPLMAKAWDKTKRTRTMKDKRWIPQGKMYQLRFRR